MDRLPSDLIVDDEGDIALDARTLIVSRKDAGCFRVGQEEYPILAWEAKTHEQRTIPLPDGLVEMQRRFRLNSGGSVYVFLSLSRLAQIDARMLAGRWMAKASLINNAPRQFATIQLHARKLLATELGVELGNIEWPMGCLHDLRRTHATEMAPHVDLLRLTRWLGHADPKTTEQSYHRTKPETEGRARQALDSLYGAETDEQLTSGAESGDSGPVPVAKIGPGDSMNADSARSSIG